MKLGHNFIQVYRHTAVKILFLLMVLCIPAITAYSAGIKITYDGKSMDYTSKTVKAFVEEKEMNLGSTPGIVIDSTSMVPYDLVFKKGLGVSCTYDSKKGVLTMKNNNHTLKMTVGSTAGTLDGESVKIPIAPKKVTYGTSTVKVLVPSEYTAESLGYGFSWTSDANNVKAKFTKPFTYYNKGKVEYYAGAMGKITVEGKKADNEVLPVMFVNDTAVGDAKKIFMNSPVAAGFKYNAKTKQLTLSKDGNKIVFTMESMTATVNGEKLKLDAAPRELRKTSKGAPYIFVPLSFTADQLGYQYSWNSGTKTAAINKTPAVATNKKYFTWNMFDEMTALVKDVTVSQESYNLENAAPDQSTITAVLKDNMMEDGNEHYIITSTTPFASVRAEYDVDTQGIRLDCSNTFSGDISYPFQDEGTVSEITTAYGLELQNTLIYIDTKIPHVKYKVELSPDLCSIYLTVYPNYITSGTAEYKDGKDVITLTGITGLNPIVSTDMDNIYVDFPGTLSAVDSQPFSTKQPFCIKGATLSPLDGNTTRLTITREGTSLYDIKTEGNKCTITMEYNKIKIAVDCGHGSNTPGKRTPPLPQDLDFDKDGIIDAKKGTSINEHTADVGIGKYLVEELKRCGFEVYESALGTEDVPLDTRIANIAAADCDYSVSVHFNAAGNGKTFNASQGIEVYSYEKSESIGDSEALAKSVLAEVIQGTEQTNRGYKKKNLVMCNTSKLGTKASILVECAFMTNLDEVVNMMGNEAYWKETASEIARGFCNYLQVPYVPER